MIKKSIGIYLPNGELISNKGNGHCQIAKRYCEKYQELQILLEAYSDGEADEFLIEAGCAAIAAYGGKWELRMAKDNNNPEMLKLRQDCETEGYKMYSCWRINPIYQKTLMNCMNKKSKCEKDDGNLYNRIGFFLNGKMFDTTNGHETTARELIQNNGYWLKEWSDESAQDFLVMRKKAIQIGSGTDRLYTIVASNQFYSYEQLQKFAKEHNIGMYHIDLLPGIGK